jgi:hypothetical protein
MREPGTFDIAVTGEIDVKELLKSSGLANESAIDFVVELRSTRLRFRHSEVAHVVSGAGADIVDWTMTGIPVDLFHAGLVVRLMVRASQPVPKHELACNTPGSILWSRFIAVSERSSSPVLPIEFVAARRPNEPVWTIEFGADLRLDDPASAAMRVYVSESNPFCDALKAPLDSAERRLAVALLATELKIEGVMRVLCDPDLCAELEDVLAGSPDPLRIPDSWLGDETSLGYQLSSWCSRVRHPGTLTEWAERATSDPIATRVHLRSHLMRFP